MSPPNVTRGADELQRLLRDETFDLRELDLPGFRRWLEANLARWRADPVFAQRVRVRDLRRSAPELRRLEREHRRAAAADKASPLAPRLAALDRDLHAVAKAIAGLTAALETAEPEDHPRLSAKRDEFASRRLALSDEREGLIRSSPERQALLRIEAELRRLRAAVGLDPEEARLKELLARKGRGSGRSGGSFEQLALELTRCLIVPDLSAEAGGGEGIRVLQRVRLGAADVELDQVIVREADGRGVAVEVLAVVEVKRNVNDLGHGFRRRQADLAWLTGETGADDPAGHRTRRFPSGRFDRAAVHRQDGEEFAFAPGSFRRFRRDPGCDAFLDRLYFVTRAGPVWGTSSAALARIVARVASDPRWRPDGEGYLSELLVWCRSLAGPVEAPDVLRLYAATPERGRRVLLVGR